MEKLKSELENLNGTLSKQGGQNYRWEENSLKVLLNREERSATLDTELYQLRSEIQDLEHQLNDNEAFTKSIS